VLVDNASLGPLREGLRGLAVEFRCHLIENAANLGIAEALNPGSSLRLGAAR